MKNRIGEIVFGVILLSIFILVNLLHSDEYKRGYEVAVADHAKVHNDLENMNVLKWCEAWKNKQHITE